jgi:hypothetical protein
MLHVHISERKLGKMGLAFTVFEKNGFLGPSLSMGKPIPPKKVLF